MKINGIHNVRNVLVACILSTAAGCATVNTPVYSDTHKPTPHELADRATKLLKELAQLGGAIETERLSDGTFRLTCAPAQCGGPVEPNFVVPHPVPPLLGPDVEKAIAFLVAINGTSIPAMNFEGTTVTIGISEAARQ